jgi:hypothetical protein
LRSIYEYVMQNKIERSLIFKDAPLFPVIILQKTKNALDTIYSRFENGPFTALFIGVQYYGDNKFVESVQEAFTRICRIGGKLYLADKDEKTLKELKKRITKGKEQYAHDLVKLSRKWIYLADCFVLEAPQYGITREIANQVSTMRLEKVSHYVIELLSKHAHLLDQNRWVYLCEHGEKHLVQAYLFELK